MLVVIVLLASNLLLLVAVFLWQWCFGTVASALSGRGYDAELAYRIALGALALLSAVGDLILVGFHRPIDRAPTAVGGAGQEGRQGP